MSASNGPADRSIEGCADTSRADAVADIADAGADLLTVAATLEGPVSGLVVALAGGVLDGAAFLERTS